MNLLGDIVVQLEQVCKHYPGAAAAALTPTSLEIRRGEFFSILGPSGSGKTTTLRMIAGFETPDSGRVILDGKDAYIYFCIVMRQHSVIKNRKDL